MVSLSRFTYLGLGAVRRLYVVHDIDVDVIQNDTLLRHARTLPEDAPENDAGLRRGHLDRRLDALEAVWRDRVRRGPFNELQIAERREIETEVLEGVRRLIDQ